MSKKVYVDGRMYEAPEGLAFTIQRREWDPSNRESLRVEYHFPRDTSKEHVRRKVFRETPTGRLTLIEESFRPGQDFGLEGPSTKIPDLNELLEKYLYPQPIERVKEGPIPMETPMKLVTGTRVWIAEYGKYLIEKHSTGIVIEVSEESRKSGSVLVCLDKHYQHCNDFDELCGKGHGLIVNKEDLVVARTGVEAYERLPEHIGVTVVERFTLNGISFPAGMVGRVLKVRGESMGVHWLNAKGKDGLWIPKDHLRWCRFNTVTFCIGTVFFTEAEKTWEIGDILVYKGVSPIIIPDGKRTCVVSEGTLLKNHGETGGGYLAVEVISGTLPEGIGATLKVKRKDLSAFKGEFIPKGQQVEISADIRFKKISLLGMQGTVILPTDYEGDVGVQFPKDIGAGSLDGIGKEGHCLYIPTKHLRQVTE